MALKRFDEALACFERALQWARSLEAIESWRRAPELHPSSYDALNNLANALKEQGRDEEAARYYRTAVALGPTHAGLHCNFGLQLLRMGDPAGALRAFQSRLRYDQENPTAKHLLAALRGET